MNQVMETPLYLAARNGHDQAIRALLAAGASVEPWRAIDGAGMEDPDTLKSTLHIGTSLISLGRFKEAEEILKRAVEVSKKVLGEEHIRRGELLLAYIY
jgi:tetratricopeptide (TPR) repeat protein